MTMTVARLRGGGMFVGRLKPADTVEVLQELGIKPGTDQREVVIRLGQHLLDLQRRVEELERRTMAGRWRTFVAAVAPRVTRPTT